MNLTPEILRASIDHTNLKLNATLEEIQALCREARDLGLFSVMVYPGFVAACVEELRDSGVVVGTVIGFPHGNSSRAAKAEEMRQAAEAGAAELDLVMNHSLLRSGIEEPVAAELQTLCTLGRDLGCKTKVIVETCYLSEAEKLRSLELCEAAGADFIKTSTGFGASGATVADIALWARARKTGIKLKASGGVRSLADARAMLEAGAERLGTSSGAAILRELQGGMNPEAGAGAY